MEDDKRSGSLRRLVASATLDLAPLKASREFRLLFAGQFVTTIGSMVTYVAVPFQLYRLTRSSLDVGLLSLCEFLPILVMAFVGGALADAIDRRRMVRLTEAGMCATTAALLANSLLSHPAVWPLFVVAAVGAGFDALQRPSLEALVPRIVDKEMLPAAIGVNSVRGQVGQIAGPPLAGVLIATIGLPSTYLIDVLSFVFSLGAITAMRSVPPPDDADRVSLRSIAAGMRYAWGRKDLLGTYAIDINAMFFGMPMALFPQVAARYGGAGALGLLYAAPAVGSLAVSATSGWVRHVRRHGKAIAVAAAMWGVAIVGFGLAPSLWLALAGLVVAGGADMVSGLFRMTMWNQTIPDEFRGRLAGIEMISYTSGPSLGNLEAGVVESLAGLRTAIVSGGLACVAGTVVLSALLPTFWRYKAQGAPAGSLSAATEP